MGTLYAMGPRLALAESALSRQVTPRIQPMIRRPELPNRGRIRTCAAEHKVYERSGDLAATFEVNLAEDGQADIVALRDSTLNDESLEKCIASALRSLSERDLRGNRAGDSPLGSVSPESRALFGQAQALGCLASPPCLLALTFLIGAAYVTVHVVVVAVSEMSKAKPEPKPIVVEVPKVKKISLEKCIEQYVLCKELNLKVPCGDCLNYCRANRRWPKDRCPQ